MTTQAGNPGPIGPFDTVIFGATGDLTMRKLLPALYLQFTNGLVPDGARVIGTSRSTLDRQAYAAEARRALERFVPAASRTSAHIERFLGLLDYVSLDALNGTGDWPRLAALLSDAPQTPASANRVRVYYLATAPRLYGDISANLHRFGLVNAQSRVVLEKPIGSDLRSARAINDAVGRYFPESQIYRIDHYLGKETVQNILALRFANPLLGAVWSGAFVESVQITAVETVGVEGRASYYDTAGALRDMIQNHLLQVLSLVALEPPAVLTADALRDAKVAVLNALRPIGADDAARETVRAQYTSGVVGGEDVPGYVEELGRPSDTETYAAIRAWVDTARWTGVPFYLRTAKRAARKVSEIVLNFRPAETALFGSPPSSNRLVIRIQPDEGLTLHLNVKDPETETYTLRAVDLGATFRLTDGRPLPDSYERLLLDAVTGDPVLFIRRDEVEAAWRWAEPVLTAWSAGAAPMGSYSAGSRGPEKAIELLAARGDKWHEDMDQPIGAPS